MYQGCARYRRMPGVLSFEVSPYSRASSPSGPVRSLRFLIRKESEEPLQPVFFDFDHGLG